MTASSARPPRRRAVARSARRATPSTSSSPKSARPSARRWQRSGPWPTQAWPEGVTVRVRMGIHTGEVRRLGDDYVGLSLHETARIAAAGHGGQVLLSAATAELVRDGLPDGDQPPRPRRAPPEGPAAPGAPLPAGRRGSPGHVPSPAHPGGGGRSAADPGDLLRRARGGGGGVTPPRERPPRDADRPGRHGQDAARHRGRRGRRTALPGRGLLRAPRHGQRPGSRGLGDRDRGRCVRRDGGARSSVSWRTCATGRCCSCWTTSSRSSRRGRRSHACSRTAPS